MTIIGRVIEGKGEGRKIGYPTANVEYSVSPTPLEHGVWIVRVLIQNRVYRGLAIVGMWHLSNGLPSVEVSVLDFSDDVYGKTLTVSLIAYLRPLQTFTGTDTLVQQIEKDVRAAREYFIEQDTVLS